MPYSTTLPARLRGRHSGERLRILRAAKRSPGVKVTKANSGHIDALESAGLVYPGSGSFVNRDTGEKYAAKYHATDRGAAVDTTTTKRRVAGKTAKRGAKRKAAKALRKCAKKKTAKKVTKTQKAQRAKRAAAYNSCYETSVSYNDLLDCIASIGRGKR